MVRFSANITSLRIIGKVKDVIKYPFIRNSRQERRISLSLAQYTE